MHQLHSLLIRVSQELQASVPKNMTIEAANKVVHSLVLTDDLFADGDRTFINNRHIITALRMHTMSI